MPIVPVNAYGFSATFKLRELVPLFSAGALGEVRIKERLIAHYGDGRYALAYDFGAVVFVGVEPAEQSARIKKITEFLRDEPHPPLTENFLIETGPTTSVQFDRVVVAEITPDVVDIVALIVAQSVAMDYYQHDVDEIETETDRIAKTLRTTARIPRTRSLIQFVGLCIATRNDVLSTLALFDKPDATWENEALDRLWDGLYRMLELDDRYKALEAKLRMFQDNLLVLVDLTRQRQTLRLEIIVAVLILFEMMIMVWQVVTTSGHP